MKVLLAMSGGVDSSVCANLLKREGHEVIGVFMKHGIQLETETAADPLKMAETATSDQSNRGCGSEKDVRDVTEVAQMLGIPLHILEFHEDFQQIVEYFVSEYLRCRTPNPCVMCNMKLKFGRLFAMAQEMGADCIATGHYARIIDGRICKGLDPGKDQSYVLHRIPREKLNRLMFPIGTYRKSEIRELAQEFGLPVASKRDSQEICFVPDDDHAHFVREYIHQKTGEYPDTVGDFVTTDGENRGRHKGLERYTIGPRKGLGLAFREPHYVVRLEPDTRRVILGLHDELACPEITVSDVNWQTETPTEPFKCGVKIRYRTPERPATLEPLEENRWRVRFDEPVFGIAPGQAAVFYDGDTLLGGGWID